tara:strand:- start:910 stop:1245 length:336 start_codon:yes stop_codon:yes gene_type:complete
MLLFLGCSTNTATTKDSPNCQNSGTIDFLYINVPCDDCIHFVEGLIENNGAIFDYNIIANKEQHILINYCYNNSMTSKLLIEEEFRDNGFIANQEMTEKQILFLENLCCFE